MFNPSRDQVRRFFFDAWQKHLTKAPLLGLEAVVVDWLVAHPEYHSVLDDPETFATREWKAEDGATNPFLHLSMHLAIEEQLSIDQPSGIRVAFDALLARLGDRHAVHHAVMDCLGEVMWHAQRSDTQPDNQAYLDCIRRKQA